MNTPRIKQTRVNDNLSYRHVREGSKVTTYRITERGFEFYSERVFATNADARRFLRDN